MSEAEELAESAEARLAACQCLTTTAPCCSKCKAPHAVLNYRDYVDWRMSFDNRSLLGSSLICARINPLTGLPWAIVPGSGLDFPVLPTDIDPPSNEIPTPPTEPEDEDEDQVDEQDPIDRNGVSISPECGGSAIEFYFTVYPGSGLPFITVAWDTNGNPIPGVMVITDAGGNVIGPCAILSPGTGGQVLKATFTPDAGCELVGFSGQSAPTGDYLAGIRVGQYAASPADCPNTVPAYETTMPVTLGWTVNPTPPVAATGLATNLLYNGATLNGTVAPNGNLTTYYFEYGLTNAYGSSTPVSSAGFVPTLVAVSAVVTGLSALTTYHFRLVATNAYGTSAGGDMTFVTAAPPILPIIGVIPKPPYAAWSFWDSLTGPPIFDWPDVIITNNGPLGSVLNWAASFDPIDPALVGKLSLSASSGVLASGASVTITVLFTGPFPPGGTFYNPIGLKVVETVLPGVTPTTCNGTIMIEF